MTKSEDSAPAAAVRVEEMIVTARSERVILDHHLARLYLVPSQAKSGGERWLRRQAKEQGGGGPGLPQERAEYLSASNVAVALEAAFRRGASRPSAATHVSATSGRDAKTAAAPVDTTQSQRNWAWPCRRTVNDADESRRSRRDLSCVG